MEYIKEYTISSQSNMVKFYLEVIKLVVYQNLELGIYHGDLHLNNILLPDIWGNYIDYDRAQNMTSKRLLMENINSYDLINGF